MMVKYIEDLQELNSTALVRLAYLHLLRLVKELILSDILIYIVIRNFQIFIKKQYVVEI